MHVVLTVLEFDITMHVVLTVLEFDITMHVVLTVLEFVEILKRKPQIFYKIWHKRFLVTDTDSSWWIVNKLPYGRHDPSTVPCLKTSWVLERKNTFEWKHMMLSRISLQINECVYETERVINVSSFYSAPQTSRRPPRNTQETSTGPSPESKNKDLYSTRKHNFDCWTMKVWRLDHEVLRTGPWGSEDWAMRFWGLDHEVLRTGPWGSENWTMKVWGLDHEVLRTGPWGSEDWTMKVWGLDHEGLSTEPWRSEDWTMKVWGLDHEVLRNGPWGLVDTFTKLNSHPWIHEHVCGYLRSRHGRS